MMGVPTYYSRLLAEPGFGPEVCRTMRLFISGSAPLLPELFEAFRERSGHAILERYGMTETGMNTTNPLEGERIAGTVGPALPGVGESAVIGLAHPDFGEAVTAVVTPADPSAPPDEAALIAAARSELAGYKLPKRVFVVEALPRNAMSKVQKNLLRERYAETYAATQESA